MAENQNQYSGWSSEAQVATLQRWIRTADLLKQVRNIKETNLSVAMNLTYAERALSSRLCYLSFSELQRFPEVWDAVNISKGDIKTNLDKVMLLADKCCADITPNDTHRAVMNLVIGNGNGGGGFGLGRDSNDDLSALYAALDAIEDEVLGFARCF